MVADPDVSTLKGTTAYRVVRVEPHLGYPAVWLQKANHGGLVIALGVLLLLVAAVIVLRPGKGKEPPSSTGLADGSGDAHETAV
jgi:hypothetical protein